MSRKRKLTVTVWFKRTTKKRGAELAQEMEANLSETTKARRKKIIEERENKRNER